MRRRNPVPARYGFPLKSAQKNDGDDKPSGRGESKNSSPLDLSLEEFPFLPSAANSIPSEVSEPGELVVKTPLKYSSPTVRNIEFGTFRPSQSPLGLHSRLASGQADSVIPYSFDSTPDAL